MKTLIIVESPAKGKKIQEFLGDDYIVSASVGHIADLTHGGSKGIGIDLENNFKPHYAILPDKVKVLNDLIALSKQCDKILLCSDPDREGEAISYHLYKRLETTGKPIKRIITKEITKAAMDQALANEMDINMNIVRSQEGRRLLDRIIGFLVSPYLMDTYKTNLSAGRVQSVCVRMILDRESDIKTFKPEEYWNVFIDLQKGQEKFQAKYAGKLSNSTEVGRLVGLINTDKKVVIEAVSNKDKKEAPPPPLTTSALQQVMARVHNFEPERTMKAAQNLYENGYCSYIRTDSVRMSEDAISEIRKYLSSVKQEIPVKPNIFKNKEASFDAHEAIRPTYINVQSSSIPLGKDEQATYEEIRKYALASQMMPAVFSTLEIKMVLPSNKKVIFKTTGKALKSPGYLIVLKNGAKKSALDIPLVIKGEELSILNNKQEQKFTQPPPRFNIQNLVKELETKEIGRPATYATILKNIESRKYVERKNNVYYPTELGDKITTTLNKYFNFLEYNYSAELEKKLDRIEDGKLDLNKMLEEFYSTFKEQLKNAYTPTGATFCSKCGLVRKKITGKYGDFYSCANNHIEKITTTKDADISLSSTI